MNYIITLLFTYIISIYSYQNNSIDNFSYQKYFHNSQCFSQGFEIYKGYIYESCGLYKKSYISKYRLGEKDYKVQVYGNKKYFFEGLTIFKDKIILLTWREKIIQIRNVENLQLEKEIPLPTEIQEGRGITNDGEYIYISNGSNQIFQLDENFNITNKILTSREKINELEYRDGLIYANIWETDDIVVINPKNGIITKIFHLGKLKQKFKNSKLRILNGIAFSEKGNMIITGKMRNYIYEISNPK